MILPADIRKKAERQYVKFLSAWLRDEPFFPLFIKGKKARGSTPWPELRRWMEALLAGSKLHKKYGYSVQFGAPTQTRTHGKQSLPENILFDSREDFLLLLGKQAEFIAFQADTALIRAALPQLEDWLHAHPREVVAHAGAWPGLLRVCAYFLQHPLPNLYLRELPIEVHSKFVEGHQGVLKSLLDALLPAAARRVDFSDFERRFGLRKKPVLVRFRVLDPALRTEYALPADDLALPMADFAALPFARVRVVVSENLMPYLTLPRLARGIAIFGEGGAVGGLRAPWLVDVPIVYWGDMDIQGFRFLAGLRRRYPQVRSVLMDPETLDAHGAFVTGGVADGKVDPVGLTDAEMVAYLRCKVGNLRLEQERIGVGVVAENLKVWG